MVLLIKLDIPIDDDQMFWWMLHYNQTMTSISPIVTEWKHFDVYPRRQAARIISLKQHEREGFSRRKLATYSNKYLPATQS